MEYLIEISFTFLLSLVFFYYYFHDKNGLPSNWPFVGMLPALLLNLHRINDFIVEITKQNHTFHFKGPWLTSMNILATVDPSNVHHVMTKNFANYPKGSDFIEIFDILGDGIFNADSTTWEYHRKMALSFFGHPKFHGFLVKKVLEKIESGLIPVLDNVSNQGVEVDLDDLFGRFTYDTICKITMDFDPKSLSVDLPSIPAAKALGEIEEVLLYRFGIPPFLWKLQRWLSIGQERRFKKAWKILDDFIYSCIEIKRSKYRSENLISNEVGIDLFALYMEENEKNKNDSKIKCDGSLILRDTVLNIFLAGSDSTSAALSWLFYLLSKNPRAETKIREELRKHMSQPQDFANNPRELFAKLVYLHAAACEALRLYPPLVMESKSAIGPDLLPSGHKVEPNTQIVFNLYAMARKKSIWGDDCCEFKPERWISEKGKIKHEPSYKFLTFNAGPRSCLGKDMALTQLKIVAATILRNYRIEAVERHPVVPNISIILHMKYGFKVKVFPLQVFSEPST